MGAVYRVRHRELGGRPVAIKEMVVNIVDGAKRNEAVAQFRREAEMMFEMHHAGLPRVTDFFEESGHLYLVMEYVDGCTLSHVINTVPLPMPVRVCCSWMDAVGDALDYLHGRYPPIIVRDLKPANVMVDTHGHVRVIDFGIARALRDDTQTSSFVKGAATAGFAPVEQYIATTDERGDIYALGATLYALLTRSTPCPALVRMSGQELAPPSALNARVPSELDDTVLRMMALAKEDRFQTVGEARQALRQALATVEPEPDGLLNLSRTCPRCNTAAAPMATHCSRCTSELALGAQGSAWPLTPAVVQQKAGLRSPWRCDAAPAEIIEPGCPHCHIARVPLAVVCFNCSTRLG
jgi:serine/threonine-protein kinase